LQQLTDRLLRLENEMRAIRQAMADRLQPKVDVPRTTTARPMQVSPWADKQILRREMAAFCASLSIHAEPIGIEDLQRKMGESGLAPNELSQSIIKAREA